MTTARPHVRAGARRLLRRISRLRPLPRPFPEPVFVLGNQKSGTSAIAALLAAHCNAGVTIDLRREIVDQLVYQVRSGAATIDELIQRNAADFTSQIIKHPNLTFIYPQLHNMFPGARYVFVVRHPHHNIRSILDRLGVAGDRLRLQPEDWSRMPRPWQLILSGEGLGRPRESHIDALADRWNVAATAYLSRTVEMSLIRYEDFLVDKTGTIARLSESVGLDGKADVAYLVDRQFQPVGAHRAVDPADFFSAEAFARIAERCRDAMTALGYPNEYTG